MRELDKVLDDDEKVYWEAKPQFGAFFWGNSIMSFLFGLIWTLLTLPFFLGTFSLSEGISFSFFPLLFLGIGLIIMIGTPIYNFLLHSHMYYAITNKRVIIQEGVIGRDFHIIDFDKITNAEVNVGIMDKIFGRGSGSVLISTPSSFRTTKSGIVPDAYILSHIDNPYEVFKYFKKVSHAVKSDIEFPNAYRSSNNPGYKTKLKF